MGTSQTVIGWAQRFGRDEARNGDRENFVVNESLWEPADSFLGRNGTEERKNGT
jgi:hypothetical protein